MLRAVDHFPYNINRFDTPFSFAGDPIQINPADRKRSNSKSLRYLLKIIIESQHSPASMAWVLLTVIEEQ